MKSDIFQTLKLNAKGIFIPTVFLIAVFLNFYAVYLHLKIDFLSSTKEASLATLTWLMSLFVLGIAVFVLPSPKKAQVPENKNLTSFEAIVLGLIIFAGLIVRLYKINHFGIYLDEWYWITEAKNILRGIVKTPFGFIGDQPSNMPAYLVAFFFGIFQNNYLAVRLSGVFYSLLNIIFVFSFLKEAINKRVALISSLLLSTSIWDIHMSQLGWNNVNLNPFLISGSIFFLFRGIRTLSIRDIFLTGLFLGTSFNLLYVASLQIIVTAVYFVYHFLFSKQRKKLFLLCLFLVVTVLFIISPTIIKIYKYPQTLIRHREFTAQNINFSKEQNGLFYYWEQLKLALKDFKYSPDKYKTVGLWSITLEPLVFIFFMLGLVYSLGQIFLPHFLIIILSFAVCFVPIVILYRFTSAWRTFSFLPTIYMLSAIGIEFFLQLLSKATKQINILLPKVNFQKLILVSNVVLCLSWWWLFYYQYYNYQLKKEPEIYETYCKKTAEYIEKEIPPGTLVLLPNELCKELISIVLGNKYNFGEYDNYEDLLRTVAIKKVKNVVAVRMAATESEEHIKGANPLYSIKIVRGDNSKIYSYLYVF